MLRGSLWWLQCAAASVARRSVWPGPRMKASHGPLWERVRRLLERILPRESALIVTRIPLDSVLPRETPKRLLEAPLRGQSLLLGVDICPGPGEALITAIVCARAILILPRPVTDTAATDLAFKAAQVRALPAVVVEAAHRARVGEERYAVLGDAV